MSPWMFEQPNALPQLGSLQPWFMLQYPFDRRVRAFATSPSAIAQYFVYLFRGEESEGIATRCMFPTVRHGSKHLDTFDRETIRTPLGLTRDQFAETFHHPERPM